MFGKKKTAQKAAQAAADKAPALSRKARRQMRKIEKKADRKAARAEKKAQQKIAKLHAATDKKLQKKDKKSAARKAKATAKQKKVAARKDAAVNMSDADLTKMADNMAAGIAKVSPTAGKVAKKAAKSKQTQSVLRQIQRRGGRTTQIIASLAPTLIPLAYAAAGVVVTALKSRKK